MQEAIMGRNCRVGTGARTIAVNEPLSLAALFSGPEAWLQLWIGDLQRAVICWVLCAQDTKRLLELQKGLGDAFFVRGVKSGLTTSIFRRKVFVVFNELAQLLSELIG
ncbi:hypothetical protein ACLKMY_20890 [Paraburkholderia mimosarum]|uniref:hypothetical protein n=1 Tax=Paraburkholderia mimosarum TaxID=312026 RepID=UPI0039C2F215